MKIRKIALLIVPAAIISFSSCGGDHPVRNLGDTVKNPYQARNDTTKADSIGADTNSMDNSGSGGTKIAKPDTPKKK